MTTAGRRVALSRVLRALASYFGKSGWQRLPSSASFLKMGQSPATGVEHVLLTHEPFQPKNLDADGFLGLACAVNVSFPEVEAAINNALHDENSVSVRLALSLLVPPDHVYLGNVYLIPVDEGVDRTVAPLLRDYQFYLAPELERLSTPAILSDASYTPPSVDRWAWDLRRAAYCRLYQDAPVWQKLFAEFKAKAVAVLETENPSGSERPFVFTDIKSVLRSSELHQAEQLLNLLAAMR